MFVSPVNLEGPWCPPSSLAPTLFLPPLLLGSLNPEGRDLVEKSHLGLSVPRSIILSGCGPLYLFSSAAEGSLMMDEQCTDL